MSSQNKLVVAMALMAAGAWWFWSQPDAARAARSPAPPAAAARPATQPAEVHLETPNSAAELTAELHQQRAEAAGVAPEEQHGSEPSLGLLDTDAPAPALSPRPAR